MFRMFRSFCRSYDRHSSTKLLAWMGLIAAAIALYVGEGGFPPTSLSLLERVLPQLTSLLSQRGLTVLMPFTGLIVLLLTWGALWLLLLCAALWLLKRALLPPRKMTRRELNWQRISADNLLAGGYDEPQATLAYAALTHTDRIASPSTPPPLPSRRVSRKPPTGNLAQREPEDYSTYATRPPAYAALVTEPRTQPPGRGGRPTVRLQPDLVAGDARDQPRTPRTPRDSRESRESRDSRALRASHSARTVPLTPDRSEPQAQRNGMMEQMNNVAIGWDAGITRKNKPNEDSVLVLRGDCTLQGRLVPLALFAVADGMGGHASGQVASHLATHSLMQSVLPAIQHAEELSEERIIETLVDCTTWANQAISTYRAENHVDLGTTLTAALVVDATAYIVNVGDSRTYLYRPGRGLSQVTRDHSLVARLVAVGAISAEEAYTHPDRNKVYRCLGEKDSIQVDWFTEPVQPGDCLLLCSDGLWEMVRDHEIEKILQRCLPDVSSASDALVKAALHRGGVDNISAIVAQL